ncbi:MAG: hypothetical protein OXK72_08150 [Gammaproteobacteria bacterium]|nr:hypothetical protein [Gammaproteobacteria bacterium]
MLYPGLTIKRQSSESHWGSKDWVKGMCTTLDSVQYAVVVFIESKTDG